jgi:hypothetical protein
MKTQTHKNKKVVYRQGDVILEKIEIDKHDLELYAKLEGERLEIRSENGHSHIMRDVKLYRYIGMQIVVVEKPTPLTHPQHPAIVIKPGIYWVRFVRDWLLEDARPVD